MKRNEHTAQQRKQNYVETADCFCIVNETQQGIVINLRKKDKSKQVKIVVRDVDNNLETQLGM